MVYPSYTILNEVYNEGSQSFDVSLQDQHTDPIIINFNKVFTGTTLSASTSIDSKTILVSDASNITSTGDTYIILFNPDSLRFSTFYLVSITGKTITLDTPLDYAYPAGTYIDVANTKMNVNGSLTSQTFGIRGVGAPTGVDLSFDVTKIIFECLATSAIDLSKFANLTKLRNGLVLRKRDGRYKNIFNVKSNSELAGICYDFTPYLATNPQHGTDGFICRLEFGGQMEFGVVIRLAVGEDLELIIQDDLSTLTCLKCFVEGHIVD